MTNVLFFVMPHFMPQYRNKFFDRMLLDEGIIQYNSFVPPKAGEKSI